ncbi:MAG TPA: hypothetical protein PLC40_04155, partial [Candidatus Hydrogenedentes bacterium]|nr:hypothetical protein [Candidatus Hydrogenedentota bacterium]
MYDMPEIPTDYCPAIQYGCQRYVLGVVMRCRANNPGGQIRVAQLNRLPGYTLDLHIAGKVPKERAYPVRGSGKFVNHQCRRYQFKTNKLFQLPCQLKNFVGL